MKEIDIIFPHERLPAINELLYKHKVEFLFYTIDGRSRETRDEVPEVISKEAPVRYRKEKHSTLLKRN